jgi:DNA-binding IclR family transcriptional regulator
MMSKPAPREARPEAVAGNANGAKDRKFVAALARGLDILRVFTPNDGLLGNQEIAQRTGLPKATVSRLTYTLRRLGYLDYAERLGKYQLATGVLALGYSMLSSMGIRQIARPFMQELADYATASVSLGSRHRLNMVYIEHTRPPTPLALRLDLGSWIPIATTAMGRAMLAALPEWQRGPLMDAIAAEEPDRWRELRAGIERAIEHYRAHGYTLSVGDWQKDVHAVGVPITLPDGSGTLAFNCGGPGFLLDRDRLTADLGPRLVLLARTVEDALVRR